MRAWWNRCCKILFCGHTYWTSRPVSTLSVQQNKMCYINAPLISIVKPLIICYIFCSCDPKCRKKLQKKQETWPRFDFQPLKNQVRCWSYNVKKLRRMYIGFFYAYYIYIHNSYYIYTMCDRLRLLRVCFYVFLPPKAIRSKAEVIPSMIE